MRIFIGPVEIGAQTPLLSNGFKTLGHEVTTAVFEGDVYPFDTSLHYDMHLRRGDVDQAKHLIASHDVFLFQFGASLLSQNRDFRMIRAAGKKIVAMHYGDDVRYWPACEQEQRICYTSLTGEDVPYFWRTSTLHDRLAALRRSELFADVIVSYPNAMQCALRPYVHGFMAASFEKYTFHVPARDIPVVVHAPSNLQLKGTKLIQQALDALAGEGVQFELRLLHNVSSNEVLRHLADADCVVDQVFLPLGLFAVEGMASGCAAATASFPDVDPFDGVRPVHRLTPHNLKEQLRVLLTDKALRLRLAHEGRRYALQYHAPEYVCHRILDALARQNDAACDCRPHFYARHFTLPPHVCMSQSVRSLTDKVIQRHGLPDSASALSLLCRGLASAGTESVPQDLAATGTDAHTRPHVPSALPPLLQNVEEFSLRAQFFSGASGEMPRGLAQALSHGKLDEALNSLVQAKLDTAGLAALVTLLWGRGNGNEALQLAAGISAKRRSSLVNWLLGVTLLERKRTGEALVLLVQAIQAFPPAMHGAVDIGGAGECGAAYMLSWTQPEDLTAPWICIAALLPDWCDAAALDTVILPVLMYICAMQGFTPQLHDAQGYSLAVLQRILQDHRHGQ